MAKSGVDNQWHQDKNFHRFVGAGVGIVAFGTVAFISAPVAIPAIGVGLGAIGVSALSGTAIGSGLFVTSAVVGGVVGGFSAPNIYNFASGLFEKKGSGDPKTPPKPRPEVTPLQDPNAQRPEDRQAEPTLGIPISSPATPIQSHNSPSVLQPAESSQVQSATTPSVVPNTSNAVENRLGKINEHFTNARTPKELLELVDHYRQSAIKKVVDQVGSFDEKKGKIEKIFQATAFGFDLKEKGRIKFQKADGGEENLEAVKDRIKGAIIRETDNFPLDVLTTAPVKQDSFNDVELLYRIVYNRKFITGILDTKDGGVNKDKALKCAFDQYKISGDEQQYPQTSKNQKEHIGEIFKGNDFRTIFTKIDQDVSEGFESQSFDWGVAYFPSAKINAAFDLDIKRRDERGVAVKPIRVSQVQFPRSAPASASALR